MLNDKGPSFVVAYHVLIIVFIVVRSSCVVAPQMPSCIPTESASNLDVEEMFLARSVYECAAVYAIYADDGQLFESNANNLFTYYGDMREVRQSGSLARSRVRGLPCVSAAHARYN
eukprot:GHVU01138684.1.p3 GENE.GHVU01138684.1~~GHVU01138684.1.p3  ORF type:complete len:116 (+),score=9.41 GHVU01138684.1:68-415(+)